MNSRRLPPNYLDLVKSRANSQTASNWMNVSTRPAFPTAPEQPKPAVSVPTVSNFPRLPAELTRPQVEHFSFQGQASIPEGETHVQVSLPETLGTRFTFAVSVTPKWSGAIRTLNATEVVDGKFEVHGEPGDFWWFVRAVKN